MRKLYSFLFLVFFVAFSQAQITVNSVNSPYSENFDIMGSNGTTLPNNWVAIKQDGSLINPVVYTSGANSGAIYNCGASSTTERSLGSLASASTIPTFGTRFVNNTGSTITQISISGVTEQWRTGTDASVNETLAFSYSTDATAINSTSSWTPASGLNINEINTSSTSGAGIDGNLTQNRASFTGTINLIWPNGATLWIKWADTNDNGSDSILALDDFVFTATTISSNPLLTITSPLINTIYSPTTTSVNVALSVNNFVVGNPGTGIDGHIHYTVTYNGGTPAMTMKYDTAPISLTSLSPGTYSVFVELVNNSHAPISPAVNATINFTIAAYTTVANLAALRADVTANGTGKYYQISSNPVVTYKRTSRNQKYIQDASGAIIIDDPSTAPGVLTTNMNVGDAIAGLKGQSLLFNGLLEILPTENATVASSGNTVTPQVVTIADVLANPAAYESELLRINGVTFSNAVATFGVTTANYDITGPTAATFRTIFTEADYITQPVPTVASDILCYAGKNTVSVTTVPNVYFVSRTLADLTLANDSFSQIDGLKLYPNPVKGGTLYVETALNNNVHVTIYDIVGKQVINTPVTNNAVNVSELTSGVYIVTVTEEGKTTSKKLVITN